MSQESQESRVLTTRSVPDEDKLDYWRTAVGEALAPMTVTARGSSPLEGRVVTGRLGRLKVSAVEADAQRATRTATHIARSPESHLALNLQVRGTATLVQNGRNTTVGEQDLVVVDTARPYVLDYPHRFHARLVHLPRHALGLAEEQIRRLTGTAIDTTRGIGSALMPYMATLATPEHTYPPAVAGRLAADVLAFFSALATERAEPADTRPADLRRQLAQRVRDHIDARLADPALTPATIAAAHHISVRYLHRIFEDEGITVARLIQRRRLEESARELSRGGPYAPTVSAIAQRWGFISPPHFSRAFRGVYGHSPVEWRRLRAESGSAGPAPDPERLP